MGFLRPATGFDLRR